LDQFSLPKMVLVLEMTEQQQWRPFSPSKTGRHRIQPLGFWNGCVFRLCQDDWCRTRRGILPDFTYKLPWTDFFALTGAHVLILPGWPGPAPES
jgi:hypothetical protein